jgi:hypothetical protein
MSSPKPSEYPIFQKRRKRQETEKIGSGVTIPSSGNPFHPKTVTLEEDPDRPWTVQVRVLYVDDRALLAEYASGDGVDVMVQTKHQAPRLQDREALVQHGCWRGHVIEDLEETDHVKALCLVESRLDLASVNQPTEIWRRLSYRRRAGFNAPHIHVPLPQRFLKEESIAAANLKEGSSARSETIEVPEVLAIRFDEVFDLVAILKRALPIETLDLLWVHRGIGPNQATGPTPDESIVDSVRDAARRECRRSEGVRRKPGRIDLRGVSRAPADRAKSGPEGRARHPPESGGSAGGFQMLSIT